MKGLVVEAEKPIPDLIRVFLPENVGGLNRVCFAERIKNDEPPPGFITTKEVEGRAPAPALHFHSS